MLLFFWSIEEILRYLRTFAHFLTYELSINLKISHFIIEGKHMDKKKLLIPSLD